MKSEISLTKTEHGVLSKPQCATTNQIACIALFFKKPLEPEY